MSSERDRADDGGGERPAFYALTPGGWRDYWTLLHPPYTLWHLSYVVMGACIASTVDLRWLVETVLAFFLAMGIAAHALDELNGRPLGTRIPDAVLWALAVLGLAGAVALGVDGARTVSPWIWAFIGTGVFLVLAYNLELFGGRIHSDLWFALAWGAFPVLTASFAQTATDRARSGRSGGRVRRHLRRAARALHAGPPAPETGRQRRTEASPCTTVRSRRSTRRHSDPRRSAPCGGCRWRCRSWRSRCWSAGSRRELLGTAP